MKIRTLFLLGFLLVIPFVLNQYRQKIESGQISDKPNIISCPNKPTGTLDINQVKPLELTSNMLKISDISSPKNIGYTFQATAKQQLLYDRSDDICFWIYRPDNNLLTDSILPITGTYTIQIASLSIQKFTLNLGLNVVNSDYRDYLKARYNQDTTSAKAFVINYYQKINQGRFQETWASLTPAFQTMAGSYNEHQQWWEKVEEVKIGRVETIEQNPETAIVSIELWYLLKSGREVYDNSNYIHLIWDNQKATWLIESKRHG